MDNFHLQPRKLWLPLFSHLNLPGSKLGYDYIETTQYLRNGILAKYLVSSTKITAIK